MTIDNEQLQVIPNLGLADKTLNDLYSKVGYTPDQKISDSLSRPDFGFFSKDYSPEK